MLIHIIKIKYVNHALFILNLIYLIISNYVLLSKRGDTIMKSMKNKLLIALLIVLSVAVYVSVNDDSKEAYRSNSGLTVKI